MLVCVRARARVLIGRLGASRRPGTSPPSRRPSFPATDGTAKITAAAANAHERSPIDNAHSSPEKSYGSDRQVPRHRSDAITAAAANAHERQSPLLSAVGLAFAAISSQPCDCGYQPSALRLRLLPYSLAIAAISSRPCVCS